MEFSAQEKSYIWLDSFPLDEGEKRKLLKAAGSAVALVRGFENFKTLLIDFQKENVYNNMRLTLQDDGKYFSGLLKAFEEKGVRPIPFPSDEYPETLKQFPDAPLVLYAKGNLELLKKRLFCIVGSRRTPAAALKTGEKIAETLSSHFSILTGVADGGDSAAITGALKGEGEVVCLLAGGFSSLPKSNLTLLQSVAKRGLILAPRSENVATRSFSYEQRNKFLAAFAEGVLVLGAGEKSGALITAKYANQFKKQVFALPYPPLSGAGCGCNALIKEGARLTETAEDVLSFYGLQAVKGEEIPLTEPESKAFEFLKNAGEAHLSELAEATGMPTYKILAVLSSLEMKGLAVKLGGNRFGVV